ncbi:GDSL-type esterase/lipase family protein [Maridesulfovibrio ferrireducens]|uniref:GDSL-type esterase/lipase family protein n=1 Tax=Maridesulfovibrio ferrireducens TaxID=246191 RepID=UPI001A27FAEE|nr:GDSL-type esterase/lipase family protein [Maridesulfovibrio ferrireducens]MBI9112700.1 hypothetical protein [Maridesulfovibrio ferrireducens]
MKLMFYTLLSINAVMLLFAAYFVHSRGGIEYLKAKYKQVVQNEAIGDSFAKMRKNKIESLLALPSNDSDILMVGDSITESGHWSELFNDSRFKNRGIGGETTTALKDWFSKLAVKKPSVMVLLIGINNLKSGINEQQTNTYLSDIKSFCKEIPQETQGYIISILPINEELSENFIKCKNHEIKNINLKLQEEAEQFSNVKYVDIFSNIINKNGQLDPAYTVDGVHLTHEGYKILTYLLKSKLPNS